MKTRKFLVSIALVLSMVCALSVSAFAVGSVTPTPGKKASDTTSALPTVVDADSNIVVAADTELCKEAYANLSSVTPAGASVRYLFDVSYKDGSTGALSLTLKLANVDGKTVTAALWNGTEWVNVKVTDNGDGTFTLDCDQPGAVAIFVK